MSTAIVYYSHHGNNALLARHLGERLQCSLVPIVETKPRTDLAILLDLVFQRLPRIQPISRGFRDYDHVILVGPVWGGKIAAPLRTFLHVYREQLHDYSFITLCGYQRPKQRDWLSAELARRVGRPPSAVCELRVSDLVSPRQRRTLHVINAYRVQLAELVPFEPAIDEFLRAAHTLGVPPDHWGPGSSRPHEAAPLLASSPRQG